MLDMFMQKATSSSIHPFLRALFTDFCACSQRIWQAWMMFENANGEEEPAPFSAHE
jgi:hypothetical protein